MMVTLDQLQKQFAESVSARQAPDFLQTLIVSDAKGDTGERLHIYRYAYQSRLREVLSVDYPALKTLLGDDPFAQMVQDYMQAYPSDQASIRWVGRHLARFLASHPPYSEQALLSEMAAFEWAQGETFDAADSRLATLQDLASLAPRQWGMATLRLIPSLRRLDLTWNVPRIWQAIDLGAAPPPAPAATTPVAWMLWRNPDLTTHWRSLETDEAGVLDQALAGASIAGLCETLCRWLEPEQVPQRIVALLQNWLNSGIVAEIQCADPG
jgi:hypothetical protein